MKYILFFDSGLGGLSVMKEALRIHPEENYIYYADNKNLPYGDKPSEVILKLTLDAIEDAAKKYALKAIVIACNTATSAACKKVREKYPTIPVIGIEPALKPAAEAFPGGNIGVLATAATLRQPKFLSLTEKYASAADIYSIPCPGLVDFVESLKLEGEETENFIKEIKKPFSNVKFDALVLGCTHYPFLKKAIEKVFACQRVFDGGPGTVNNLFRSMSPFDFENNGERIFINSANLPDFSKRAIELLEKH